MMDAKIHGFGIGHDVRRKIQLLAALCDILFDVASLQFSAILRPQLRLSVAEPLVRFRPRLRFG